MEVDTEKRGARMENNYRFGCCRINPLSGIYSELFKEGRGSVI